MVEHLYNVWSNTSTTYGRTPLERMVEHFYNVWTDNSTTYGRTPLQRMVGHHYNVWSDTSTTYGRARPEDNVHAPFGPCSHPRLAGSAAAGISRQCLRWA
eukprot:gene7098-2526_t